MERQLVSPSFPSLGLPPFTEMGLPLPRWVRSTVVADPHCHYSKQAKDRLCSSGSAHLPGLAERSPQGRLARMKMLGFESGPERQLGAHSRDPGQTVAEGCGGADVGPTEPGEGSGALLRLLAAPRCYPCQRTLPPGQACGHILRQRPRHRQKWVSGCVWLTVMHWQGARLPFSLRCREQATGTSSGHLLHGWQGTRRWALGLTWHGHPHALPRSLK